MLELYFCVILWWVYSDLLQYLNFQKSILVRLSQLNENFMYIVHLKTHMCIYVYVDIYVYVNTYTPTTTSLYSYNKGNLNLLQYHLLFRGFPFLNRIY